MGGFEDIRDLRNGYGTLMSDWLRRWVGRLDALDVRWRSIVLIGSFLIGLTALMAGAEVTERAGISEASFLTKVYYTLGLFMFGGLDLGVPRGDPFFAQVMLWVAYFACPAVTTAAVVESAIRFLDVPRFEEAMEDHIVVAGGGVLTDIYLNAIADEVESQILLVTRDEEREPVTDLQHRHRVTCLQADMTNPEALESLHLPRAREIMLVTGDDFQNLEIMQTIHDELGRPELDRRVHTHVSNLLLLRNIKSETIESTNIASMFNAHRQAAEDLVEQQIDADFQSTEAVDQLVLAGFGRFGQSLLWALHEEVDEEFDRVVLVDREVHRTFRRFRRHVEWEPRREYELEKVEGDITDPGTWDDVKNRVRPEPEPVFVLSSDEDTSNMQAALWLAIEYGEASIYARTLHHWHFADKLAEAKHFHNQNIDELTRHAIRKQSDVVDERSSPHERSTRRSVSSSSGLASS